MKFLKNIFPLVLLVFCAVSCIKDDEPAVGEIGVGDTVPDFTVQMNDGSVVTGASLRKGVSLIMFFNTGCPDCRNTLPAVQQMYSRFGNDVSFALISREQGDEEIAPYWESEGYSIPYSAQTDRSVYNLFATTRVPRVYVCLNGVVEFMYHDDPIATAADLEGNLSELLF